MNHEARRKTLGASEIAAACGKSPFTSREKLFEIKTGRAQPFKGNRATEWGQIMEPVIADYYLANNDGLDRLETSDVFLTTGKPWSATPDRIVFPVSGPSYLLEIKTAADDKDWGKSGTTTIPEYYYMQVQWQLYVCNYERCDVACLIGSNDYRQYQFQKDRSYIDWLIHQAEDFWGYVERDERPPAFEEPDAVEPTPEIEKLIAEKVAFAELAKVNADMEKEAREKLIKLVPSGKCKASTGSCGWQVRKGKPVTDWEAAFHDLVAAVPQGSVDLESIVASRTETKPDVAVFTVRGAK